MITLELLTEKNIDAVCAIHREDIPVSWVDDADTLWELTQYGLEHNCIGHTYAIKQDDDYIGVILLGEAIPWETDPEEMKNEPFYRLMGFVIDNRYRSQGIGSKVLDMVIDTIYKEYGVRPIALGVHKDNHGAARFYERHGFVAVDAMEGNDRYYLRYPKNSFWDSSWESVDPNRIAEYIETFDMGEDNVIAVMRQWGVHSVCDAGCGCGIYAAKLAANGFSISGFDVSAHAVEIAQASVRKAGYSVDFKTASILNTGYENNRFDCVLSRDVLDHISKADAIVALKELCRITKPGGIVLFTLDSLDEEYETETHIVNADGDYVFTDGKWNGMVFHPYSQEEVYNIIPTGVMCELTDNHGELTVLLRSKMKMRGERKMTFVETPRLLLRKVTEDDFPYFRADLADKEMDRMMLRWPCETEEEIRLGFEWFLYKEERAYAIVHKETGETIGNLTVYNRVPECVAAHEAVQGKNGKALSFAVLPAFQRKGYMYEAVSSVIDHLFRVEKADYINCGYLSYNAPSKALQEKLGFTYLLTERFRFDNQEMESIENILWRT